MKCYQLTKCFKKKMSKVREIIITTIIVLLVIFIAFIFILAIAFGIGYIYEIFMFGKLIKPFDTGWSIILISTLGSIVIYWMAIAGAKITTNTTKFIKERYEGEPMNCSIFEECTSEPEDNEEYESGLNYFDEFNNHPMDNDLKGK